MVEVMKILETSVKKSHACTAALSALDPAAGAGTLNTTVCEQDFWEEVVIIFITPTIVWSQVKQGGNTASRINRKLV